MSSKNINSLFNDKTDEHIKYFVDNYKDAKIIAAWGNRPRNLNEEKYRKRIQQVINYVGRNRLKIVGAITKKGYPRHGLSWNGKPELYKYSKFF